METAAINIKDLSVADRPREKLIKLGPAGLSNSELIAIVLRSGTQQIPLMVTCNAIVKQINDNAYNLATMEIEELVKIPGLGEIKAVTLLAAIELGKRSLKPVVPLKLNDDKNVEQFIANYLSTDNKIQYHLILLNNRSELLATSEMVTENGDLPALKTIMKLALEAGAFEIILCRNDIKITSKFGNQEKAFIIQADAAASMLKIKMRGLLIVSSKKT